MSLLTRVYVLVLLAAIPGFALELYRDLEYRAEGERRLEAEVLRLAEFADSELTRVLEGGRLFLAAVAAHPSIQNDDWEACSQYLGSITPIPSPFRGPYVVAPDGAVTCTTEWGSKVAYVGDRDYFRRAVSSGRLTVGDLVVSRVDGALTLPLALPVLDDRGGVRAVVAMGIAASGLQEKLQERKWPPGGSISIIDRSGTVVVRWPNPERVGQKMPEEFRWMLSATAPGVTSGIGPDGVERVGGFMPPGVNNELLVTVAIARKAALGPLDARLWRDLAILATCALVTLVVTLLSGRALIQKPLRVLGAAVERLRQGDHSARVGLPERGSELNRLGAAFDAMAAELERQQVELRRSEAFFRQFAEDLPEVIWIEDIASGRLVYVNLAYEQLWGRSRAALLSGAGDWVDGVHPEDRSGVQTALAKARAGTTETIEYRLVRPDGTTRWLHSTAFAIRDSDGTIISLARVSRDITGRRDAVLQRELLFQELNHRIKNNLQIASSLLNLQARRVDEPAAKEALAAAGQRLIAVADLHSLLYRKGFAGTIDLADYIGRLCDTLADAMLDESGRIIIETRLDPVEIGLDRAVSVGFIVTEAVANSVKHAFPAPARGRILVALSCPNDLHVLLSIGDDGCGVGAAEASRAEGFGLRIVRMFAQQLGGTLTIRGESGTTVELAFPRHNEPNQAAA